MIPTLIDILAALLAGEMTTEEAAHYLKAHQQLQAEVDNCAEDVPYERGVVLMDAINKMAEQDKRWGARHYPAFDPQLQLFADTEAVDLAREHGVLSPKTARLRTDSRGEALSWMDILVEEVAKLTECRDGKLALRLQLIDVAGVALQWAQTLVEPPRAEFHYDEATGQATASVKVGEASNFLSPAEALAKFGELSKTEGGVTTYLEFTDGHTNWIPQYDGFQSLTGYRGVQEADHEGPNLR